MPHEGRIYTVERALREGASVEDVYAASGIDPWFVDQVLFLQEIRAELQNAPHDPDVMRAAKRAGFSDRQIAAITGSSGPRSASVATRRDPAGLQDGRHVRRRIHGPHALPLQLVRRGDRGRAPRARSRHRAGQRAQPDRPGHRVRLRLLSRGFRAVRRRLRDGDGQLQPGDRLHRLRHQRSALLASPHRRGRARSSLSRRGWPRRGRRLELGGQTPLGVGRRSSSDAGVPVVRTAPVRHPPRRGPHANSARCSTPPA